MRPAGKGYQQGPSGVLQVNAQQFHSGVPLSIRRASFPPIRGIHDNKVRLLQGGENAVEFTTLFQIKESGVRVKPFQRGILVVAINGNVSDAFVLEELDEIHGEEAFADSAFAVEDEVETFHVLSGLSIRTCAMRGPRLRVCGVPLPLVSAGDSGNGRSSAGSGCAGEATRPFGSAKDAGRFRAGLLRGRTISVST